nr:lipopolysaccharide biosynthesis protein RfbH [Pectinatus frisingensis]
MTAQSKIREKILASVREYYNSAFAAKKKFIPGNKINYGGRFFDEKELVNLVNASLDFWLTTGRYCSEFESNFAKFLDVRYCSLTNSGSSANLLAFMALTSAKLGERRVKKGDEVITVAAGFPTTVAPIIQYGAVPVFVDVTLPEYNIDVSMLEKAYSKRTKVVMVAHTLGNPFDLQTVRSFCDEHNLWLIEDNCDALGSEYYINGAWKYTGTIGDIGTSSFYPPHHMTMGEGGAVYTDNSQLYRIINSFRDWGRDCWCASGHDNTCQNRFSQQFGELPFGYDHKYVYSHFGYNLKATEMQAAIGCAQLKKLPFFIKKRRENWQFLWEHLSDLDEYFILPKASQNSKPSWFGFLITVREAAKFSRNEIVTYLEKHNIQTRMLFAGNLIKHPCFDEIRGNNQLYRVVGSLDNTDCIMERTFWLGVYPGIDELQLKFMLTTIRNFLKSR